MSFENVRSRGTIELVGAEAFFSIFVVFTIFLQFYGVCMGDQYWRTFVSTSDTIVKKKIILSWCLINSSKIGNFF